MKVIQNFIISSLLRYLLAAVFILLGFTPEKWIASLFTSPPLYLTAWWGLKLWLILLGILLFAATKFLDNSGRNQQAKNGTSSIFQDDEELTFTEIAQRWSDSAHPKDGFSHDQVMTFLVRAIWQGKIGNGLAFNFLRANTDPLLREYNLIPNRSTLAFVLAHFWSQKGNFFTQEELKCFSIREAEARGETLGKQIEKHIDRKFVDLKTWDRLASLNYDNFREAQSNIIHEAYLRPLCIKKKVFLIWLKKSKIRLPANW